VSNKRNSFRFGYIINETDKNVLVDSWIFLYCQTEDQKRDEIVVNKLPQSLETQNWGFGKIFQFLNETCRLKCFKSSQKRGNGGGIYKFEIPV
jgi:hypothetical protein